jgi:hypothetical protein
MGLWTKLRALPSAALLEKSKIFTIILVWVLGFIVLVRGLALIQFLLDLDYSEVNMVRLIQFVFLKILILSLLAYYMYLLWRRPHRLALGFLILFCIAGLYQYRDLVSVFSSLSIGIITFLLYLKLYVSSKELEAPAPNAVQIPSNK